MMREMPHMTILVPCDPAETEKAVMAAAEIDGPVYIRVARPVCEDITTADTPFTPGRANVMKEGSDVCLIACGLMIPVALEAAKQLEAEKENGVKGDQPYAGKAETLDEQIAYYRELAKEAPE